MRGWGQPDCECECECECLSVCVRRVFNKTYSYCIVFYSSSVIVHASSFFHLRQLVALSHATPTFPRHSYATSCCSLTRVRHIFVSSTPQRRLVQQQQTATQDNTTYATQSQPFPPYTSSPLPPATKKKKKQNRPCQESRTRAAAGVVNMGMDRVMRRLMECV
jgi:hypothetical protein